MHFLCTIFSPDARYDSRKEAQALLGGLRLGLAAAFTCERMGSDNGGKAWMMLMMMLMSTNFLVIASCR